MDRIPMRLLSPNGSPSTAPKHRADADDELPTAHVPQIPRWARESHHHIPTLLTSALKALLPSFLIRPRNAPTAAGAPAGPRHATAYLDGLRGIAALVVFLYHFTMRFSMEATWAYNPAGPAEPSFIQLPIIRLIIAGRASVSIFFVISGYVLSTRALRLIYKKQWAAVLDALSSAVLRRPLRLYLPVVAVTFGVAVTMRWHPEWQVFWILSHIRESALQVTPDVPAAGGPGSLGPGIWRDWAWAVVDTVNPLRIVDTYRFADRSRIVHYAATLWTIGIEFKGSIVIFLLVLALSRARRSIAILITLFVGVFLQFQLGDADMALFCIGLLFAELALILPPTTVARALGRTHARHLLGHAACVAAGFVALYMLSFPDVGSETAPGFMSVLYAWTPEAFRRGRTGDGDLRDFERQTFWLSVGAPLLILALMYAPPLRRRGTAGAVADDGGARVLHVDTQQLDEHTAEPLLQKPFTSAVGQYLGRISYSLYLVHDPILRSLAWRWSNEAVPLWWHAQDVAPTLSGDELAAFDSQTRWKYRWLLVSAFVVCAVVIFWVSDVCTRLVDEPSIRLARWLGRWTESPRELVEPGVDDLGAQEAKLP